MLRILLSLTGLMLVAQGVDAATHRVPRVEGVVRADGLLEEPFWDEALRLDANVEISPGENVPAPVQTQALIAYNGTHLVAAIRASDPRPTEIRARYCDRDELWVDDWSALILDTFNDNRRTFEFFVNPLGVQADMIATPTSGDDAWDAIWDSGAQISDEGYVVEIAIPFKSLRFEATDTAKEWGIDIVRNYPRGVRHRFSLFPRDRSNNCYMCQSDTILGFENARPGRNFEITPTFTATRSSERTDGEFGLRNESYESGVTARWGVTTNLSLSGTLNPDFSQVEADAVQLDINTPFALFYPETRPFFVEDAQFFQTKISAVQTRTLRNPRWGGKLTGKQNGHTLGFFSSQDDVTNLIFPAANSSGSASIDERSQATALRYSKDFGRMLTVGGLYTDRQSNSGYYNRVAGIDTRYLLTPRDSFDLQFLASGTRYSTEVAEANDQPEGSFEGAGVDFLYYHNTRGLDGYAAYKEMAADLRADLGFVPQVNYRLIDVGLQHSWFAESDHWWNYLNVGASFEHSEVLDGENIFRGSTLWADYNGPLETTIRSAAWLGERRYAGTTFQNPYTILVASIRPAGWIYLRNQLRLGYGIDYTDARRGFLTGIAPRLAFVLGRHVELTLDHQFEELSVEAGRLYTANISATRLVYQPTNSMMLRAILQYVNYDREPENYISSVDSKYESLFSQLLFSYKLGPRTVFYLGYSGNAFGHDTVALTSSDRTLFMKVGYAWTP